MLEIFRGDDTALRLLVKDFDAPADLSGEVWVATVRSGAGSLLAEIEGDAGIDATAGLLRFPISGDVSARWPLGEIMADVQFTRAGRRQTVGRFSICLKEDLTI